jgi:hypothetical protein
MAKLCCQLMLMCGGVGMGPSGGLKNRADDPEHGTTQGEVCILAQRATISSKRA